MKRYKSRLATSCFLSYLLLGEQIQIATSNQKTSVGRDLSRFYLVTLHHRFQSARILSQCARSEQVVVRRDNQIGFLRSAWSTLAQRCMFAVAREQIHARDVVARYKPLNLVENRHRIQRAQLGLEALHFKPDGMAVGLSGLCSAGLPHIRPYAAAEGN